MQENVTRIICDNCGVAHAPPLPPGWQAARVACQFMVGQEQRIVRDIQADWCPDCANKPLVDMFRIVVRTAEMRARGG